MSLLTYANLHPKRKNSVKKPVRGKVILSLALSFIFFSAKFINWYTQLP